MFGHEFCGTVAEYGPGCRRRVAVGAAVVALPLLRTDQGLNAVGISAAALGAYAEQVVVEESLMFAVPNGLPTEVATLTEPMAIGWHAVRRAEMKNNDETLGIRPNRPVIFECVGIPGMLDQIVASAPLYSRIVVAGVCMVPDTIRPVMAINKEVELRFVVGYTPLEFRDALRMLANGKVNPARLITSTVGLGDVQAAFDALARPDDHAKIIIDPRRT